MLRPLLPAFPLAMGAWLSFMAVPARAEPSADAASEVSPAARDTGAPATDDPSGYGELVGRGVAEFNAGRFAEARALFLQAHESSPTARTWRTLGMTAFELRMYPHALSELQAALDDTRRPLPDALRGQVQALLAQTRGFVGRYRVRTSPPGAELFVDGAQHAANEPVVLPVGAHTLLVRTPGYQTLERRLLVQGREDQELELVQEAQGVTAVAPAAPAPATLPAPAAASAPAGMAPQRIAAFTALGVGAASFIAAGVFTGISLSHKSGLSNECPQRACPPEYEDQRQDMQRFADYATLGSVLGAAGMGTFAVLWLTAPKASHEARTALRPWVGPGSAGLSGRF